MIDDPPTDHGVTVRLLMRRQPRVALGTLLVGGDRAPYVSLAMVALDHNATPLLLLSDLADHTRNLKADPRVSLLFDGTAGSVVALAGERASVQGRAVRTDDQVDRARYLRRHPDAAAYGRFRDFNLYRVEIERAHLVAGFGRIRWIDGSAVRLDTTGTDRLRRAEPEILAHMNEVHADAVQLYAQVLCAQGGRDWRLTGVDPEGADLLRESAGMRTRLSFARIVRNSEEARAELLRLVKRARDESRSSPSPDPEVR
jgi:putative heme iron utilization protein